MIADGKKIAEKIENDLKDALLALPEKYLCFVMVGENAASEQFVAMKTRVAKRLGVNVALEHFPDDISQQELEQEISNICSEGFDGVVVQLPLPNHLNAQEILDCVPANLDCDVLGAQAKQLFAASGLGKIPPVARAVSEILDFYDVSLSDKNVLIVGNGKLVGQPIGQLFHNRGISFHVIDKDTQQNIKESELKSADVIISGTGSPHSIHPELIKEGVILIDAGTSEQSGKLVGDIDPACAEIASLTTPVPGGVGPVTVACLFANLIEN